MVVDVISSVYLWDVAPFWNHYVKIMVASVQDASILPAAKGGDTDFTAFDAADCFVANLVGRDI